VWLADKNNHGGGREEGGGGLGGKCGSNPKTSPAGKDFKEEKVGLNLGRAGGGGGGGEKTEKAEMGEMNQGLGEKNYK